MTPIFSVQLQPVRPATFLWALPLLPALGAGIVAAAGPALSRRFGRRSVAAVAVAAAGGALGVALAAALGVLAALPAAERGLLDRGASFVGVELGLARFSATLAFDPIAAPLAILLALAGVLAQLALASAGRFQGDDRRLIRTSSLSNLCVAAALLTVLADNLVLMLAGWEAVGLCAYALMLSPADDVSRDAAAARSLALDRGSGLALLAGVALLFWGAGGVFGPRGYEPGGPRAVTADVRGGSGAAIELRTKGDRSPVAAVRELPVGPSLVFHELADRLSLEDTAGERPFARELASRRVGGLPVLMVVGLALLLAIAGKLAQLPRQLEGRGEERQPAGPSPSAALAATATVVVCGYLSWRSWFLFAISPPARLTVALGGGALLAWAALVVAVRPARAPLAAGVDRLQRELGVLPAVDLARGAAWLESHGLDLAGRLVAGAAVVMLVILLVR